MTVMTAWQPFREFTSLQERMNQLFNEVFSGVDSNGSSWGPSWFSPKTDIYEEDDHVVLEIEAPGMREEDLQITLENNVLTVSGERKPSSNRKQDRYQRSERFFGSFSRTFTLPASVNPDGIEAKYENGVLYLTMPKKAEAKPRQIRVNAPAKQLTGKAA